MGGLSRIASMSAAKSKPSIASMATMRPSSSKNNAPLNSKSADDASVGSKPSVAYSRVNSIARTERMQSALARTTVDTGNGRVVSR
jgi:hypothetical protein